MTEPPVLLPRPSTVTRLPLTGVLRDLLGDHDGWFLLPDECAPSARNPVGTLCGVALLPAGWIWLTLFVSDTTPNRPSTLQLTGLASLPKPRVGWQPLSITDRRTRSGRLTFGTHTSAPCHNLRLMMPLACDAMPEPAHTHRPPANTRAAFAGITLSLLPEQDRVAEQVMLALADAAFVQQVATYVTPHADTLEQALLVPEVTRA